VVIPTLHARDGDRVLLHGSPVAGMFRAAASHPVCLTVTHVDGIVLARSVFHHSVNYRSVVVHGEATRLESDAERLHALECIVEHISPGQWTAARRPSPDELRQTDVWSVPLDSASVKLRTGPPTDEPADLDSPVWAGVLPLAVVAGPLEPAPDLPVGRVAPEHLQRLARGCGAQTGG
jgi:hypothetical protein